MDVQNYKNHRRLVIGYHFVLALLALAALVGAAILTYRALRDGVGRLDALVLLALSVAGVLLFWYCRIFPLRAQDRAIRAEESLRHYVLTGALPDARLKMRQYIGLRFASDVELPALAKRAAEEGLSEDAIKRAIETWRADTYRV